MKLKRLEIFGFKSFSEKTLIDFCDGVTSVVGSNGSGKSNIIEAIRWVMGEQRTRTLRCKKMEDLIFNGSDSLKPLGMAEVRLTLTNGGRPFPPPMTDYDEVMVARRLYRDGTSEYELNGVSCRLTDIVDFFLDTGIGRDSYAIIEQGRVEQIIAAKPEERRIFLEEAASINRYKARRESAIKKLEQTNENLLRIKDIVFEVKKQSQLLKKQARKAERYRELKNRIRDLEINLEASKCQRVSEKLNQLKNSQEMLVNELTEKETRLGKLTANLESTRLQISEIQISFNELSEKLRFAEIESNNAETALANFLSRENELTERRQRIEANRDSLIRNETAAQNRLKELELQHEELVSSRSQFSEKLKGSQKLIEYLKKSSNERDGTLEQFRNDLFQALQDLSKSKNQLEQNLRRQTELKTRLNKFGTDFLNQSESLGKTLEQKHLAEQGSLKIQQSLDLIESESENNREKRSTMVNELKSLNEKMRGLERDSISIKTKLESLNEQNRNYASYSSGTQFVMKHFSSLGNLDILKPVAELIQCPREYSTALTSALNTLLGAIVVKDFSCALELAEKIKDLEISRVDIVSLDSFDLDVPDQLIQQDHIKKLSDLVTAAPSFKGLMNHLLRDFYVVENVSFAKDFFRNFRKNIRIVTLKGEIVVPERLVSLGSLESPEKDVLSKKFETDSLVIQVADVDHRIREVKTIIDVKESELIGLQRKIEQNSHIKSELRIEQAGLFKDLDRLKLEASRLESGIKSIELDQKRTRQDLVQLVEEHKELTFRCNSLEKTKTVLTEKKQAMEKHAKEARLSLDQEIKRVNEIRINLVQTEERKKSIEKDINSTRGFIKNCERQTMDSEKEFENLTGQAQHLVKEKTKIIDQKNQFSVLYKKLLVEQAKTQELFNSLKLEATKLSDEEILVTRSIEQLKEQIHFREVELARLEETLRNSVAKILERHNVDPRFVKSPSTTPDENELIKIRSDIESMGEVNLAAISESLQVESRLTFLLEQENDLNSSVRSLFSTIQTIDRTTTQRFHATFQEVNSKFREIFSLLFNGGEAWLELIGSEDSTDHGVNIIVKPPGKRLQNVDLLSGGEKALTAIAFIFAIFLYKPSAFCLLDEVDAPLDDSNVDRFNQMIKDLSRNTQFVVITHNKKSMEGSDCLFGVTSEATGASKMISVKFSD